MKTKKIIKIILFTLILTFFSSFISALVPGEIYKDAYGFNWNYVVTNGFNLSEFSSPVVSSVVGVRNKDNYICPYEYFTGINAYNGSNYNSLGLVNFWNFDNDNSTTAIDATGRNNGTKGSWVNSTQGTVNKGYIFPYRGYPASNNSIDLGVYDLGKLGIKDKITIAGWIKHNYCTSSVYWPTIISRRSVSASNDSLFLSSCYNANPSFIIWNENGKYVNISGSSPLTNNTWYYIVATYNGSNMQLYINGALVSSGYQTGNINNKVAQSLLGAAHSNAFNPRSSSNTQLDEVMIFNRSLSDYEIKDLYNLQLTGKPLENKQVKDYCMQGGEIYDNEGCLRVYFNNLSNKADNRTYSYWNNSNCSVDRTVDSMGIFDYSIKGLLLREAYFAYPHSDTDYFYYSNTNLAKIKTSKQVGSKGIKTIYLYDSKNRVTGEATIIDDVIIPISYEYYDGGVIDGYLKKFSSLVSNKIYTYENSFIKTEKITKLTSEDSYSYTITNTYDPNGNKIEIQDSYGGEGDYGYVKEDGYWVLDDTQITDYSVDVNMDINTGEVEYCSSTDNTCTSPIREYDDQGRLIKDDQRAYTISNEEYVSSKVNLPAEVASEVDVNTNYYYDSEAINNELESITLPGSPTNPDKVVPHFDYSGRVVKFDYMNPASGSSPVTAAVIKDNELSGNFLSTIKNFFGRIFDLTFSLGRNKLTGKFLDSNINYESTPLYTAIPGEIETGLSKAEIDELLNGKTLDPKLKEIIAKAKNIDDQLGEDPLILKDISSNSDVITGTCVDYDMNDSNNTFTESLFISSNVLANNMLYQDICVNATTLKEYTCSLDNLNKRTQKENIVFCDYGCSNSRCQTYDDIKYNIVCDKSVAGNVAQDIDSDGYLDISTCCQLQNIQLNLTAKYKLLNDIECSDTKKWFNGQGFVTMGNSMNPRAGGFGGVLDGKGFIIYNLTINRPSQDWQGLFGVLLPSGTISNLTLENFNITGKNYVGGFVAGYSAGNITNSYALGNLKGITSVGLIVGYNYNAKSFSQVYAFSENKSLKCIGSNLASPCTILRNSLDRGTERYPYSFNNCTDLQNLNSVKDSYSNFGLYKDINCSETKSWNLGKGFKPIGNQSSPFKSNFYGKNYSISGIYINRSKPVEFYQGLFGYISGATLDSIRVTDIRIIGGGSINYTGGLVGVANMYAKINRCSSTGIIANSSSYTGGLVGMLSGGCTLQSSWSSMSISALSYTGGLVGYGETSHILSSSSSSPFISGTNYVGGSVGYGSSLTILSSSSSSPFISGTNYVGGLAGYSSSSKLSQVYANVSLVTSPFALPTTSIGGLIGYSYRDRIDRAYSGSGIVRSSGISGYIGGLIGSSSSFIIDSYSNTNVSSNNTYVAGGLVGTNNGGIERCYSTGHIAITELLPANSVGGLVGRNLGNISYSFSTSNFSNVSSTSYFGGVIGQNSGGIKGVYYVPTWNATLPCCGLNSCSSYPYQCTSTTKEFFYGSGFSSWLYFDFDNIWRGNTNAYPTLR